MKGLTHWSSGEQSRATANHTRLSITRVTALSSMQHHIIINCRNEEQIVIQWNSDHKLNNTLVDCIIDMVVCYRHLFLYEEHIPCNCHIIINIKSKLIKWTSSAAIIIIIECRILIKRSPGSNFLLDVFRGLGTETRENWKGRAADWDGMLVVCGHGRYDQEEIKHSSHNAEWCV